MLKARGGGAYGKTVVFGITDIVRDGSKATLQAIVRGKVDGCSLINSNG